MEFAALIYAEIYEIWTFRNSEKLINGYTDLHSQISTPKNGVKPFLRRAICVVPTNLVLTKVLLMPSLVVLF